jgi:heme-degrading monooxygenase HmoA
MSVVEVTLLRLKGVAPYAPALLESLSSVRGILKTQSEFYSCIEDPTLIFILGLWPSLEAHHEFLASPRAAEVLGPQETMLEFRWTVHMPLDAMALLPLDAPVLAVNRRQVRDEDSDAYDEERVTEEEAILQSSGHRVVGGWRLDAAPGTKEALLFTGWQTAEEHAAFRARPKTLRNVHHTAPDLYEIVETYHAQNMERRPT